MEIECKIDNLKNHQIFLKIKRLASVFLQKNGFEEIDTPLLSPKLIPESYLEIFETKNLFNKDKQEMYLIPSPELFLKRLIVEGIGNCYFLGKSFRNNEPVEKKHSYEFTMLEFYRVNGDYFDIIEDVMEMLRFMAKKMFNKNELEYQGKKINLNTCEKITVAEAFKKYAGITDIFNHKIFFGQAKEKGYRTEGMDYTDVWSQIYGIEVEPNLGKDGLVTFIYEYPRELAAITKINELGIAERFEFYIEGVELGNCGNEGVEIEEYKGRFLKDIEIRKKLGLINYRADYEFISILDKLPKCAGIAIGMDRLAMIFTNTVSISDLQLILIK
jgi:elongation factor P--beta-lysine ligase